MWLATEKGFFSIVKKGGEGKWSIRARARRDIENLVDLVGMPRNRITSKGGHDYPWRIIIDHEELGRVMLALTETITYYNFKSHLGTKPDQHKHLDIYHRWWGDMLAVEDRRESKLSGFYNMAAEAPSVDAEIAIRNQKKKVRRRKAATAKNLFPDWEGTVAGVGDAE